MTTYKKLYNEGIKYLHTDLEDIIHALDSGESVCLCSAYKMGDRRLIDYLAYYLGHSTDYYVIYDENNSLDVSSLEKQIRLARNKKIIILLPTYPYKSREFQTFFQKFMFNQKNKYLSVILLHHDFLVDPTAYFPDSISPISYVKMRRPLNFEMTRAVIEARRRLNGWNIPKKFEGDIYKDSGGIIGLIKRLCSYVDKYGNLELSDLLSYPPIVSTLSYLKGQFDCLDERNLRKLGLIDRDGEPKGDLLRSYIFRSSPGRGLALSPSQARLLDLFLRKKGEIVSMDQIDECLRYDGDYSMWGTYQSISRFKRAILRVYRLENVRGKGYILTDR